MNPSTGSRYALTSVGTWVSPSAANELSTHSIVEPAATYTTAWGFARPWAMARLYAASSARVAPALTLSTFSMAPVPTPTMTTLSLTAIETSSGTGVADAVPESAATSGMWTVV